MTQFVSEEAISTSDTSLQKEIFRLSALLYMETTDAFSSVDVQLYMVKCVFADTNTYMSSEDIISYIANNYKYHLSEEELENILNKPRVFESVETNGTRIYRLLQDEHEQIVKLMSHNIEYYINLYITIHDISDANMFRNSVYIYLYELTTTNINSYKVLLSLVDGKNFMDADLSVNVDELSDLEKSYVHDFISWDNADKNIALSNLVLCCLEYCLLVSGDKPNRLISKAMRSREVFLDTNIIFRALGINGVSRQNVVLAFLQKCKQANIQLIIGSPTKYEFFSTVDYYITQISEFPRGKVYNGAYETLCEFNLYSFYDEWYSKHENLSLKYFRIYIASLYDEFIKKYKIIDNLKIPNELAAAEDFKSSIDNYAREIIGAKRQLKSIYISEDILLSRSDMHDATMVRYIELYRAKSSPDTDIFFVSSDKGLRYWEMTRTRSSYPIVIYPSQIFLVLIKLCGRSENDMESFVSFINIRPRSQQLSAEKANIILSGISSITEDITAQQNIVTVMMEGEFQNIIKRSNTDQILYQQVQLFSQNYLEADLDKKEKEVKHLITALQEKGTEYEELLNSTNQKDVHIQERQNQIKEQKEKVCSFAEGKIIPYHVLKWYVFPTIIILYSVAVVLFIAFQFVCSDAPWNFAVRLVDTIEKTVFGKKVGDYLYGVDLALSGSIVFLFKKIMVNPFDKIKRRIDRTERVQRYISKHRLL